MRVGIATFTFTLCFPEPCILVKQDTIPPVQSISHILKDRIQPGVSWILVSIPGSGRSPREGNGNLLQYSYLGNPMDRGSWWATVHRVTESDTPEATSHTCMPPCKHCPTTSALAEHSQTVPLFCQPHCCQVIGYIIDHKTISTSPPSHITLPLL